jgi:hypothetical protein
MNISKQMVTYAGVSQRWIIVQSQEAYQRDAHHLKCKLRTFQEKLNSFNFRVYSRLILQTILIQILTHYDAIYNYFNAHNLRNVCFTNIMAHKLSKIKEKIISYFGPTTEAIYSNTPRSFNSA